MLLQGDSPRQLIASRSLFLMPDAEKAQSKLMQASTERYFTFLDKQLSAFLKSFNYQIAMQFIHLNPNRFPAHSFARYQGRATAREWIADNSGVLHHINQLLHELNRLLTWMRSPHIPAYLGPERIMWRHKSMNLIARPLSAEID